MGIWGRKNLDILRQSVSNKLGIHDSFIHSNLAIYIVPGTELFKIQKT